MAAQIQRCILKGKISGVVETRNMFIAQVDVVPADTRFNVWKGYIDGIFSSIYSWIAPAWTAYSLEIQKFDLGEYETLEEGAYTLPGTATGDALANLVAAVLIGKAPGKRLMGRKFISPLAEIAVAGNSLVSAALADFADAALAYFDFYTTANGSSLGPGIIDKAHAYHAFNTGWVSSLLGTIRRRKPNIGI